MCEHRYNHANAANQSMSGECSRTNISYEWIVYGLLALVYKAASAEPITLLAPMVDDVAHLLENSIN